MKRTHLIPVLSSRCEGMDCRACPRPWRYFVTGMELWGRGDNATFLEDATEDYRRKPTEKLTRARWRRVLRRWILFGFPWFLLDLSLVSNLAQAMGSESLFARIPWVWVFVAYVVVAMTVGIFAAIRVLIPWWATREERKLYIYPAARQLARVTGSRFRRREAVMQIELPENFGEEIEDGREPEPVRLYVPEVVLDDNMKKRIANAVGSRLGLPEPIAKWTESGVPQVYCDLYPMAVPPASIEIADIMEEILASPIERPVIGVANGRRVIRMDLVNDSPHSLGSAASGGGKSTLYKLIAMQLDFKKWSHLRWAGRIPGGRVLIEDEVERIHNVLCRVLDELLWRKSFELEDEAKLDLLPTLDVFVEEINTLIDLLIDYWDSYVAREKQAARTAVRLAKDSGDEVAMEEAEEQYAAAMGLPKKSPAVQAIRYGVNLGREFRIHFHFIGQSIDAKAAGGRNTRESFRTRFLARWDRKTWRMLADGIPFVACPSGAVGLWAHVHGSEYEIVRVPRVPDEVAVEFVLGGERPSLPMFHGDPVPTIEGETGPAALPQAMPLSKIIEILPLKTDGDRMTLDALRTASKREGFPEPFEVGGAGKASLYVPEEILAWFRDRERIPTAIER
jgi:hypothetical protein